MPVEPANNPEPTTQPVTCGNYNESAETSEVQAVPGVAGDGADTSISTMAAQGARQRHASYMLPTFDAGEDAELQSAHGGAGQGVAARSRPSYVASPRRRRGELASLGARSDPLPTTKTIERVSTLEVEAGPGGLPLPPPGSSYAPPRRLGRVPTAPTTIKPVEAQDMSMAGLPTVHGPSSAAASGFPGKKKTRAACPCCLLSCPLVLAIGFSLMVVYLWYHPQPPRMRVTTATLRNSTHGGGRAASYSLSIQARIFNPNTELHVVLRYVQLDLYFQGSLVGTQAVWPAPIHEAPGDSVLRSAHLVVNVTQEHDVSAWQNATNGNGGIKLLLVGRFHSQLNFGRRLPFRFWVHPRCTLWLDPLRGGALRQSWC